MKLIKRTNEGEDFRASIIGWKIIKYVDVTALRISIYLKALFVKIEIGRPKDNRNEDRLI